ncbi:MAG TPA: adenylate/guanylate cyclase domain-containing protein [Nitrososphaerales archaeon]|nr:adenylate/guanylate cyclase domain-containing protein [Nitrososphaerales archaeon]
MSDGERRLAAIMFTDVVGFTSLGQVNEELALQLLEEHRGIVRPIVAKHRGTEVKTIGDAFLVEFASALEAVKCAVEIQTAMRERNSSMPEGKRLQMRIGIHVGEVVHSQGDILGDAVNVSSRIEPIADPGGICISEQVFDHVQNKLDVPMEPRGEKTLKNVRLPVGVYKIVMPWEKATVGEASLDSRRVAVLPLKNMSPDPNDEYFAEGMTEELITALSSVTELTVIARTSVMQYKNAPKRIVDVGRELSVGTVIEGSVRKAGNKVRITVQVIDAKNEGHLWAQNYDKQLDDVFTVQSEVAERVAEALKVKLIESEKKKLERGTTADPEAHNLYLKGMFYWNKRTADSLRKAADYFEQATKRDPTFALGHAGQAQAYFIIAANGHGDPELYYQKTKEAALRALSIDEGLAEAHAALAAVAEGYDRDLSKAEAELKRAIELNPSYPSAHQWYAQLLGMENRFDESWKEINRARELSPFSLIINTNLADAMFYFKEFDKGIQQCKKVIEIDPTFEVVYLTLINNYTALGRFKEAEAALDEYSKLASATDAKLARAAILACEGKAGEARMLLEELEALVSDGSVSAYQLACCRFRLGDNDRGFELMELAYSRYDRYVLIMGIEPEFDRVRTDPRYLSMLQKIGLAGHIRP